MKVLGIESSCDETAAAIVEINDDLQCTLLSNVVASSMDLHVKYGGVVPEIAARSHIESILPVIDEAVLPVGWDAVDAIAVTYGAGLGGSLLVGVMTARTLAIAKNKPLYGCNHVEGHVYANFITAAGAPLHTDETSSPSDNGSLDDAVLASPLLASSSISTASSVAPGRLASSQSPAAVRQWQLQGQIYTLPLSAPQFPCLALIVSGGHSQLVLFRGHFDYTLLGQTQDDAIGEAFDKVAKMIGMPYPGGPSIGKLAPSGNPSAFELPKAKMPRAYDFSFSGVKTAVLRHAQAVIGKDYTFPSKDLPQALSDSQKADIAAVFQRVAIETVVDKAVQAYEEFSPASVVIAGGVAASPELRRQLSERIALEIQYTDPKLCTDNGAMIATLGAFKAKMGQPMADPYALDINPSLSM